MFLAFLSKNVDARREFTVITKKKNMSKNKKRAINSKYGSMENPYNQMQSTRVRKETEYNKIPS